MGHEEEAIVVGADTEAQDIFHHQNKCFKHRRGLACASGMATTSMTRLTSCTSSVNPWRVATRTGKLHQRGRRPSACRRSYVGKRVRESHSCIAALTHDLSPRSVLFVCTQAVVTIDEVHNLLTHRRFYPQQTRKLTWHLATASNMALAAFTGTPILDILEKYRFHTSGMN